MTLRSLQSYTTCYFKLNVSSLTSDDTSSKKCWCFVSLKMLGTPMPRISREFSLLPFPSDIQQTQETFHVEIWKCICNNDCVRKGPSQQFNSLWIPVSFKSYWKPERHVLLLISVISVSSLSRCGLFDQALRNELCVLKIQAFPSFIWISFVCSMLVLEGICTLCVGSCHLCI